MKSTEEQLRKRGKASLDDIEELSSLEVKKRILLLSHEAAWIRSAAAISLKKDVEGSTKCGLRGIWYTQGKEPEMEAKFPVIKSFENVNIDELLK